jgi:hypothetical protein
MIITRTISQILAAGIAITAFSLLLYTFGFNKKNRVAKSFTIILVCVLIIFTADAIGSTTTNPGEIIFWQRLQWLGLIYIPPAYFHFSDALLETTGRPSHGKRRWAVRITYLASCVFTLLIPLTNNLEFLQNALPQDAEIIRKTVNILFGVYYVSSMFATWTTYIRAWRRTTTSTTRRRMTYLITGAIAPALGCLPYLISGSAFATTHNLSYWTIVMISNLFTGGLIVSMAYAVAFFGVNWPDRVVKRRLFKWVMRGPVTAILVLGVTTVLRRAMVNYSLALNEWIPISMVLVILLMEYAITIFSPLWERWLFYGNDRYEIELTSDLADRLMTHNDLSEFLETIVAAISDRFRASNVFISSLDENQLTMIVKTGKNNILDGDLILSRISEISTGNQEDLPVYQLDGWTIIPLFDRTSEIQRLIGILGFEPKYPVEMDAENSQVLTGLTDRISSALRSRELQATVYKVVQNLNPQFEQFQQLRAQTRFASADELAEKEYDVPVELTNMVKDALTHFWGGPKLTDSPLVELKIVQQALDENNQSAVNALRSILRLAIERVKPEGERKFTGEWVLYNILDMKFIQGKKVREVAMRLAMSEADLYRKQRIAIEAVAKAILEMENNTSQHKAS